MARIAIVTDTDASLPKKVSADLGIHQVPIAVSFGSEVLKTGIEIDDKSLFERVDRDGKLPTTSAPAPGDFAAAFGAAFKAGAESVLCFCVSSEMSATFSAAESARQTMPERDIHILDTLSLSMGQGFMVMAAAEAAQHGSSITEIISLVESLRERTYLFAVLPTLKYLAMSGRVGQVAAGVADIISIKPLLTIKDGKLDLLERVRTLKRAYSRAVDLCLEAQDSRPVERLAIVHVRAEDEAQRFYDQLIKAINFTGEPLYAELTPGLSVHTGAGLVGTCFVVSG
jgi:DegV family protein with EDD domain